MADMTRKLFFLEESPKTLVISNFSVASIFIVEFETEWNDSKCKLYPVKIKYYLAKIKIWKKWIFVINYLENVFLR